jgi:hypothetical protein
VRAWKKGAVIGAVWGLISTVYSFFIGYAIIAGHDFQLPLGVNAIILPTHLAAKLQVFLDKIGLPIWGSSPLIVGLFLSILFAISIVSIIGFAIEKYKQKP